MKENNTMKKSLTLALALVALAVFTGLSIGQEAKQSGNGAATALRGETQARSFVTTPAPRLQSTSTEVNWPATLGKKQLDLIRSLRGQKLTAEVVGDGPQAVIVIYGSDGSCRACIGSGKACAEACPTKSKSTQSAG
jgi:hypothetical protein